ncbi:hypothetical protein SAMN05443144_104156 [Fodinibius roseus]|uniref:Transposase n=1 Tax=Fodinibius roseus TaxID=1194090 RepID=A0A1M4XLA2_9BACT|nr:hypothetical protein [Fodinibius roseus]SHE94259.1 hypothetical protein SAMN05443144_104156 [Fodinibius roseus]
MTSEENKYSPEFKKKVARKALEQSKQNLESLSEQYGVPVSVILMWATELEKGGDQVFETAEENVEKEKEESENLDLSISDEEVASAMEHGVMFDNLNYKRLVFWSVLGIILVIVFVQALFEMFQYNERALQDRVSAESGEFYQATQLKKKAEERITSFGIVNLEEGTYRMPVDSVINDMAADGDN